MSIATHPFQAAVDALMAAGMPRQKAVNKVVVELPHVQESFIAAANEKRLQAAAPTPIAPTVMPTAVADFRAAIDALVAGGMARQAAAAKVAKDRPDLQAAAVAAANRRN